MVGEKLYLVIQQNDIQYGCIHRVREVAFSNHVPPSDHLRFTAANAMVPTHAYTLTINIFER